MSTNIGTTLSIATGAPATEDATGYNALTWVKIVGVLTVPQIGDTQGDVTSSLLETGRVKHSNGEKTIGNLTITVKDESPDAGMTAVIAAAGAGTTHSFKAAYANGTTKQFYGLVANYQVNEASTSTEAGAQFEIRPNSALLTT